MSLKIPLKSFKTTGFRLSLWYSGFFISCSVLILILTHIFLSSALTRTDKAAIASESSELIPEYNSYGMSFLQKNLSEKHKAYRGKNPFFIRIADLSNRTLYILYPELWKEFDLGLLEVYPLTDGGWTYLPAIEDDFHLMMLSKRLNDGRWLQLGRSSEVRDQALDRFFNIFFIIIPPLVFVGLAGGIFLAARALRPIQHMIQTVQSIVTGNFEARVPCTEVKDELNELAKLFNEMIERINALIIGMKESLDNVAHDLRTPMTRLRSMCETALRSNNDIELYRDTMANCLEESDRIIKMLTTLMDISEAETGVIKLHKNQVNLLRLLTPLIDMFQFMAEEKGVALNIRVPETLDVSVDPARMTQALANIFDNAIKYTPGGGQITIETYLTDGRWIITVTDTGEGISQSDLPKIWDRLYRGDASRSTKGLGLGLSFVKAIVQAHQGTIEVVSTVGRGSTFIISLPSTS